MIEIDQRLRDAHREHHDDLARRGVLDHTFDTLICEGMSVEDAMREELRRANVEVPA